MAQTTILKAERRTQTGKGAARQLRRSGRIPAVIYGQGRDTEALQLSQADLEKALAVAGTATLIELKIDGKRIKTLIREVQRHPTGRQPLHVDFLEIHAGEKITVRTPIHLVGSPEGVRNQAGVLDQILRELEIKVLPKDLPEQVELDVTDLLINQSIHVRDIEVPDAEILEDPNKTVCTVVPPRVEAEPTVVVEEEEEEAVEPELIRKPKAEEEGEGEAESAGQKE